MKYVLSVILALGLLAAGCSDDEDGGGGDGDADTDTDTDTDSDTDSDTDTDADADPCDPEIFDGEAGATDGHTTQNGLIYNVRTPDGYDTSTRYPLIVVYAPAGADEEMTESFTGLTADALAAGYIIGYSNHLQPSSQPALDALALVPDEISEHWCVDTDRIYVTGHSDGGSTATIMGIFGLMANGPAAIAPSASGTSQAYFDSIGDCPAPLPVMIMHSSGDTLFPGYGLDARDYWVACNGCGETATETLPNGCLVYSGCDEDVEVQYCESTGAHGYWPGLNDGIISFFDLF